MKAKCVLSIVVAVLLAAAGCGGGGGGAQPDIDPSQPLPPECPPGQVGTPPDCATPPPVEPEPEGAIPPAGQAWRGQDALKAKVTAGGRELQGKVFIWDPTYDPTNTNPANHHNAVKRYLLNNGVPESNIIGTDGLSVSEIGLPESYPMNRFFDDAAWATQRAETRVVVLPVGGPFMDPGTARRIAENNVLFVAAGGNTPWDAGPDGKSGTGELILALRNFHNNPNHINWTTFDEIDGLPEGFSSLAETINAINTDKAIFAVWANVNEQGEVVPDISSVKCAGVERGCFAVIVPWDVRGDPHPRYGTGVGTSFAAPTVGAAAFYLRQMWDKAEEVVGVMRQCAIDVGAPGVDEEFGQGVVNVDCPTVANREVRTVVRSVQTNAHSPAMSSLTGFRTPLGGGAPIHSFARTPQGTAGHLGVAEDRPVAVDTRTFMSHNLFGIGKHVRFDGGEVIALVGSGTAPLGVRSYMVPSGEVGQTAFAEIGGKAELFRLDKHSSLSAIGSYGYDTGGMKPQVLRLGLQAKQGDESSLLQVYVGYAQVSGEIGIPGRHEVGRNKVSFTTGSPEARLSYMVRF